MGVRVIMEGPGGGSRGPKIRRDIIPFRSPDQLYIYVFIYYREIRVSSKAHAANAQHTTTIIRPGS